MNTCLLINETNNINKYTELINYYLKQPFINFFDTIYILYTTPNIDIPHKIKSINLKIINILDCNNIFDICDLKNYDYLVYLNNDIKFDLCDINFNELISILDSNNKLNQIILDDYELESFDTIKINDHDYIKPILSDYDFDDVTLKYNKIKQIFSTIDTNLYNKSSPIELNYNHYIDKKYYNFNYFKLTNSIIKLDYFKKHLIFPINEYTFKEKEIARELMSNNYYSLYINKPISIEYTLNNKITDQEQNYNNMTLVTGFIKMSDNTGKRHPYNYIESSVKTLQIPQFMVIYVTDDLVEHVKNIRKDLLDKTKIIVINETNLYMYEFTKIIEKNVLINSSPYNNSKYIQSVNTRYDYLKDTINNNYFNTEYICWIDFSMSHVVKMKHFKIAYNNPNKVRIAWICRKNANTFVYNNKCLGGGLYCAHMKTMLKLIELHNKEFLELMNLGYCINDDKTLFLVFEKYPELFDCFYSGYVAMCDKINNSYKRKKIEQLKLL